MRGDETTCSACGSAFRESDSGAIYYTRVAAPYRPLAARLARGALTLDEARALGRELALNRARGVVAAALTVIGAVALFACAIGGAAALAPAVRDSRARIQAANAATTTPAESGGRATQVISPTAAAPSATPTATPSGALSATVSAPAETRPAVTVTIATRAPVTTTAAPTLPREDAAATPALPPTFTPSATPNQGTSATPTPTPTPAATRSGTVTATLQSTGERTATPTPTRTPTPTAAPTSGPTSTATLTATSTPAVALSPWWEAVAITSIDPKGSQPNQSDESVVLANTLSEVVSLSGWSIYRRGAASAIQVRQITLLANSTCRLYTNFLPAGACGTFQSAAPLWNDAGDTLELLDDQGRLVSVFTYP